MALTASVSTRDQKDLTLRRLRRSVLQIDSFSDSLQKLDCVQTELRLRKIAFSSRRQDFIGFIQTSPHSVATFLSQKSQQKTNFSEKVSASSIATKFPSRDRKLHLAALFTVLQDPAFLPAGPSVLLCACRRQPAANIAGREQRPTEFNDQRGALAAERGCKVQLSGRFIQPLRLSVVSHTLGRFRKPTHKCRCSSIDTNAKVHILGIKFAVPGSSLT